MNDPLVVILFVLMYLRYEEMVELLVKSGANVNVSSEHESLTAMHQAAELCSLRAMTCLLNADADMNTWGMSTVLHTAANRGCIPIVELLLKKGAQQFVNAKDNVRMCPILTFKMIETNPPIRL